MPIRSWLIAGAWAALAGFAEGFPFVDFELSALVGALFTGVDLA
jgi:hypothetical protein